MTAPATQPAAYGQKEEGINVRIDDHYRRRHPQSQAIAERAQQHFPGGVTHDARWMDPFPIVVDRAEGAYKWDVDGNRLIDYWQGHGTLLMGHAYPPVVEAIQRQAARGTHYGANSELEVEWAEQVKSCFPNVEQLRFTASGTEATMLALRVARAFTGKPTVVRLLGHFHGWHDLLAAGTEGTTSLPPGVLPGIMADTHIVPSDLTALEEVLTARDDIAAVILEPSGASYGAQPLPDAFVRSLRQLCSKQNVLLIFDEVVTGFRVAPGGVQERAGVTPDLTCLAKILAGGLPGGAVGGRTDVMRYLAFGDKAWNESHKIKHHGTFNANPLSAAAGIAMLSQVRSGTAQTRAAQLGRLLCEGMNAELRARQLAGCAAYGDGSIIHIVLGLPQAFPAGEIGADVPLKDLKMGIPAHLRMPFRLAMLNYGVDLMNGRSAFVSAVHTEDDIRATVSAFGAALDIIKDEREL